jgi:hypothetical protein
VQNVLNRNPRAQKQPHPWDRQVNLQYLGQLPHFLHLLLYAQLPLFFLIPVAG